MPGDGVPLQEFVEESSELLQGMEEIILEWDNRPGDRALVDALFRTVHTIKGGAGVVMRMDLSDYAHRLEGLLDRVRSGQLVHSKELVSIFLDADVLNVLASRSEDKVFEKPLEEIKNIIYKNIYNNLVYIFH